jgi:hypothetical protein
MYQSSHPIFGHRGLHGLGSEGWDVCQWLVVGHRLEGRGYIWRADVLDSKAIHGGLTVLFLWLLKGWEGERLPAPRLERCNIIAQTPGIEPHLLGNHVYYVWPHIRTNYRYTLHASMNNWLPLWVWYVSSARLPYIAFLCLDSINAYLPPVALLFLHLQDT